MVAPYYASALHVWGIPIDSSATCHCIYLPGPNSGASVPMCLSTLSQNPLSHRCQWMRASSSRGIAHGSPSQARHCSGCEYRFERLHDGKVEISYPKSPPAGL